MIEKLLSLSSSSRGKKLDHKLCDVFPNANKNIVAELEYILGKKNGFYAFESALNFYSNDDDDLIPSIGIWNNPNGWKASYESIKDILFFAEDSFGDQFGINEEAIVRFKPETGKIEHHSSSMSEWVEKILSDYDYETAWSIAHQWQLKNGRLRNGYRLLPKKPFVLGGEYESGNLVAIKKMPAMQAYGNLYKQIRDVPDGQTIKLKHWL